MDYISLPISVPISILVIISLSLSFPTFNKKDGYRQQNVRQRQKLISIIDYESVFWSICSNFGDIHRQRMA